jgi:hypothetical protein
VYIGFVSETNPHVQLIFFFKSVKFKVDVWSSDNDGDARSVAPKRFLD